VNIVWAFATAGYEAPELFEAVAPELVQRLRQFQWPHPLVNAVWAYAEAQIEAPDLFAAVAARLSSSDFIEVLNGETVALAATAFSKEKTDDSRDALFDALARKAADSITNFKSEALTKLATAFARRRHSADERVPGALFLKIRTRAARTIDRFSATDVTAILRAFAGRFRAERLCFAIAEDAPKRLADFTTAELVSLVEDFSKSSIFAPDFFAAVAAELETRPAFDDPPLLVALVWAFAEAGLTADVVRSAATTLAERLVLDDDASGLSLSPSDRVRALSSFACFDWPDAALFEKALPTLFLEDDVERGVSLDQLSLAALHAKTLGADLPDADVEKKPVEEPAQLARSASILLKGLGWPHVEQHRTEDGFLLDLADPEAKCAVVVHTDAAPYVRRFERRDWSPSGLTNLRLRLLNKLGWRVATLAFFEWDTRQAPKTTPQLIDVLVDKLTAVGADLTTAPDDDDEPSSSSSSSSSVAAEEEEEEPSAPSSSPAAPTERDE